MDMKKIFGGSIKERKILRVRKSVMIWRFIAQRINPTSELKRSLVPGAVWLLPFDSPNWRHFENYDFFDTKMTSKKMTKEGAFGVRRKAGPGSQHGGDRGSQKRKHHTGITTSGQEEGHHISDFWKPNPPTSLEEICTVLCLSAHWAEHPPPGSDHFVKVAGILWKNSEALKKTGSSSPAGFHFSLSSENRAWWCPLGTQCRGGSWHQSPSSRSRMSKSADCLSRNIKKMKSRGRLKKTFWKKQQTILVATMVKQLAGSNHGPSLPPCRGNTMARTDGRPGVVGNPVWRNFQQTNNSPKKKGLTELAVNPEWPDQNLLPLWKRTERILQSIGVSGCESLKNTINNVQ